MRNEGFCIWILGFNALKNLLFNPKKLNHIKHERTT